MLWPASAVQGNNLWEAERQVKGIRLRPAGPGATRQFEKKNGVSVPEGLSTVAHHFSGGTARGPCPSSPVGTAERHRTDGNSAVPPGLAGGRRFPVPPLKQWAGEAVEDFVNRPCGTPVHSVEKAHPSPLHFSNWRVAPGGTAKKNLMGRPLVCDSCASGAESCFRLWTRHGHGSPCKHPL
jgi:hypothetical protein